MIGRPRASVAGLPQYKPGRSAAQAAADHGLAAAIKLASNETPFGPISAIADAIAAAAHTTNRYPDHRSVAVREALAARLGVEAANVTVGSGSVGLLFQLFGAYVEPGDRVVYPWRSFEVHPVYSALTNAKAVTVPLTEHQAFDLAAVAAAATPDTKLVVLSTPNNPTGTACRTAELLKLLEAASPDTVVVIDEAYREFVTDPLVEDPITAILPHHSNAVVLRTFSKAYGLADLRVGYAVGHPDVIGALDKVALPFAVSGVAQAAAIAALSDAVANQLAERVDAIIAERERITVALTEAGWPVTPSQGNFVWLAVGDEAVPLFSRMEAAGVVVRPFEGEGVRITVGAPDENQAMLDAIGVA